MNQDAWAGAAVGVALLAAMVGTFLYEAAYYERTLEEYSVTFAALTTSGPSATGHSEEGQAAAARVVALPHANLTEVVFVLTWTDTAPSSPGAAYKTDRLGIRVEGPEGDGITPAALEEEDGEIRLVVTGINPLPNATAKRGATEDAVRAAVLDEYTSKRGSGNWTVHVEDVEAYDPQVAGSGHPTERDTGNDWSLTVNYTRYEARLSPA